MILFTYFNSLSLKELLLEKRNVKLMEVAAVLEDKLKTSFDSILISENATKLSKKEQVEILNEHLQPLIMDTVKSYPGYGMGFYCRKLEGMVAMGPKFDPNLLGKAVNNSPKIKLYKTGLFQMGYVRGITWGGKTIMALDYPIYRNGKLIGHAWANKKVEDIDRQFYLAFFRNCLVIFLIWLIVIGVIGWLFKRLEINLNKLYSQISDYQDNFNSFKEFPELLPVLETVIQLRNRLKEETIQCRNEAQKLNQLIDLCPVYITVIDGQEKIVKINKAYMDFLRKLGLKVNLIGEHFSVISEFFGRDYKEASIIHAFKGEQVETYTQLGGLTLICSAMPIKDTETNSNIGAISVYYDITEYEKMREEIVRLDRLNIVSQMAASVAHEIRNPMSAIRGYAQLLMRRLGEEHSKYFNIILEELDRANSIIGDFLSLAKNKHTEKEQRFINDIINDIYPLIYGEAVEKEITVRLDLPTDVPSISINEREIRQVILNLVRNAIEAMTEKGNLTIKTKAIKGGIQLVISDTGCGISKENLGKIFSPFYTDKDNGTGLGLSVCLSIIERHQGSIEVESQEGVGTTFTITLHNSIIDQENKEL